MTHRRHLLLEHLHGVKTILKRASVVTAEDGNLKLDGVMVVVGIRKMLERLKLLIGIFCMDMRENLGVANCTELRRHDRKQENTK